MKKKREWDKRIKKDRLKIIGEKRKKIKKKDEKDLNWKKKKKLIKSNEK